MKRPLVFILLFLIYGIMGGQHLGAMGVVLFMAAGTAAALVIRRIYSLEGAVLLIIVSFIGFVLGFGSVTCSNREINALADTDAKPLMSCTVLSVNNRYDHYSEYTVKLRTLKYKDKTYTDDIRLKLITNSDIEPGDIIEIKTEIKHGGSLYNENYRMLSRHIEYSMKGYAFVTGYEESFNTYMYRARERVKRVYDSILPHKEAGLLKAIILGDRLDIEDGVYTLFRNAGIVHIIAISGLHISIFASILMLALSRINKTFARIFVLAALLLYAIFTGGAPSVVRAVIMMYILTIGNMLGRDYDLISSCSLACILLLLYSPCYIYDAGFQYSFAAVYFIGMTSDILHKYGIGNKYLSALIISAAVCYGLKPITLHYFGYINFVDIIVNIIVVSFMEIIILFGGMAGIVGIFSLKAGIFIAGLPYVGLKCAEYLCQVGLMLPLSNVEGSIKSPGVVVIYIGAVVIYLYLMNRKDVRGGFLERT